MRQFMATDLRKMLRAETRCSRMLRCFSCLRLGGKKEYVQSDLFLFLFFLHCATPRFCWCPLPGIEQRFGEEAKQSAVVSLGLRATALHQRAHDSAHQDTVDRLGGGAEQAAVHLQEICGTRHVKKKPHKAVVTLECGRSGRARAPLTVPLLRCDVAPVLAHRQDVLHQQAAVVVPVGRAAVGVLQHLRHMFEQIAALQTGTSWWENSRDQVKKKTY